MCSTICVFRTAMPMAGDTRMSERMGRLAASCVIAVIGSIVLTNACQDPSPTPAIAWWLAYTLGAGLVLSTQRGEKAKALALLAILPALTPIIVFGFLLLRIQRSDTLVCMSFPVPPTMTLPFAILLPLITWLAIFIFSFGWVPARAVARFVLGVIRKPAQVTKVANAIRLLVSALVTIVMLISVLGR
jgi:hypothetical protein